MQEEAIPSSRRSSASTGPIASTTSVSRSPAATVELSSSPVVEHRPESHRRLGPEGLRERFAGPPHRRLPRKLSQGPIESGAP